MADNETETANTQKNTRRNPEKITMVSSFHALYAYLSAIVGEIITTIIVWKLMGFFAFWGDNMVHLQIELTNN